MGMGILDLHNSSQYMQGLMHRNPERLTNLIAWLFCRSFDIAACEVCRHSADFANDTDTFGGSGFGAF